MPNPNIAESIVVAFKDLAVFVKTKWRATIVGTLFLLLIGMISLGFYFGFVLIKKIDSNLNHGVDILEETYQSPEDLQEGLARSVEENLLVENMLTECVYNEKADAVIVAKFHDSKTDLQGKHDFFFSATNEVLMQDMPSFLPDMQNIPIVRLGEFMGPMLDKKCQMIDINNGMKSNKWLREKLKNEGISKIAVCPIYDLSNKNLLGFTELVFLAKGENIEIDNEILKNFNILTEKVALIISK